MTAELTPYGERPLPPGLAELRVRAEDLAKQDRWPDLVALGPELEADAELWPTLWAPLVAVAARRAGRADAWDRLVAAVDGGFRQEWVLDGLLESAFGADPGWAAVRAQMAGPVPAPPVELLEWPTAPAMLPLVLDRVPGDRDAELAGRLPAAESSAWETARQLLAWVAARWEHANDHVRRADALDVLDRVGEGARFACVEYSIVLSQALNAVRIPARRVALRTRDHHTGVGRGHVVSEAWVDDLARWVLLDGQNGSYWADDDGQPLGVLELQRRHDAGDRAAFLQADGEPSAAGADTWWSYFASASTTGVTWSTGPFSPVFQDVGLVPAPRLVRGTDDVAPDLTALSTGITRSTADDGPALTFTPVHPYATAVRVACAGTSEELRVGSGWDLPAATGEHVVEVSAVTPYGVLPPSLLHYLRR